MGFESCHPFIILTYYIIVIICAASFDHPVFAGVSFLMACLHYIFQRGKRALFSLFVFITLIPVYSFLYSMYHHFGVTRLWTNFAGNPICLEAVIFGFVRAMCIVSVLLQLFCFFEDFSSEKLIFFFGRISPRISVYLSVLFRNIVLIRRRFLEVIKSREGIGMGIKAAKISGCAKGLLSVAAVTKTISMESLFTMSSSMRCRGLELKGRRAFARYRFTGRDSMISIVTALLSGIIWMAFALDQCHILYDPYIEMPPTAPLSFLFYGAYAIFLLIPFCLHTAFSVSHQ